MLTKKQILNQLFDLKNILGQFDSSIKLVHLETQDQDVISYALDQSVLLLRIVQKLYEIETDVERDLWDTQLVQWCDTFLLSQINPILADLEDTRKKAKIQLADLENICNQAIPNFTE